MSFLRDILRRGPSEDDLKWEQARKVMEQAGGKDLMIRLATELREVGDASAIVEEHTNRNSLSELYAGVTILVLSWDLRKRLYLASTWWDSKSVRIDASHTGEVSVRFTPGWHEVDGEHYRRLVGFEIERLSDMQDLPWKEALKRRELINEWQNKLSADLSFEEKVRTAMALARHDQDFRFGEGQRSISQKLVKSQFSQIIF